jgi:hypothetical protein
MSASNHRHDHDGHDACIGWGKQLRFRSGRRRY